MFTAATAGGRASARPRRRGGTGFGQAAAGLALLCGCSAPSPAVTPSDAGGTATASATVQPGGAPAGARPMARSVPIRLRIPAIGVDTAVMSLGLAADGTVGVPPIAAHSPAGWYDGSPTPGQTGPSVILGHVTVGGYGDGVFLHLDRLHRGDRVLVARRDGTVAAFTVDSVKTVAKSHFPSSAVYGNVGHPALRLITCGGTRVTGSVGYPDNVIVYASLAADS